jgi:hypothetical protein
MPNDQPVDIPAISSRVIHKGMVWDLVSDTFDFNGEELTREYIKHTGAVAVLTINDKDELLLLKQYRRPVGSFLMEFRPGCWMFRASQNLTVPSASLPRKRIFRQVIGKS